MKYYIPVVAFALYFFSGCALDTCGGSAAGLVRKMDAFIEKVAKDEDKYSSAYWKSRDEEYGRLMDECFDQYEATMTSAQKRNYWRASRNYLKMRIGNRLINLFKSSDDQSLDAELEVLITKTSDAIESLADDPEWKELQSLWQEELKSRSSK